MENAHWANARAANAHAENAYCTDAHAAQDDRRRGASSRSVAMATVRIPAAAAGFPGLAGGDDARRPRRPLGGAHVHANELRPPLRVIPLGAPRWRLVSAGGGRCGPNTVPSA